MREREKGEGESDRGRDTDGEENREGRRWVGGGRGGVNFNRVKMRCKSCFTERAVDNYANMMAA